MCLNMYDSTSMFFCCFFFFFFFEREKNLHDFLFASLGNDMSIFNLGMVWIENLSRGSLIGILRLDSEWRIFLSTPYTHDRSFSCIPFDLPHFIFEVEFAIK